jgi:N4-gp56 family major capsid protein
MSTYNSTINAQTLAEAKAMDPNVKAQMWARYLEIGSKAHDVFSMFESEQPRIPLANAGKRGIFCRRRELKAQGGDLVHFTVISAPGGPGVMGEAQLAGQESASKFKTYSVKVDWHRDAVAFTKKQIAFMATGNTLEETTAELLKLKMGLWKQNDMMMALLHLGSGNIYRPNGKKTRNALGPNDSLSLSMAVAGKARLNTMGGKPIKQTLGENGDQLNGFLTFASEYAFLDIRNDQDYTQAIQNADNRGPTNAQFSGRLVTWQGQSFFEHIVTDQDWDDYIGSPIQPKAMLAVGFGADSAVGDCVLKASTSNIKNKYFQFFPGHAYKFTEDFYLNAGGGSSLTPDSSFTPLGSEYYAWIINPDGTIGFVAYTGSGNNGNQITVTKILNPNNTADGSTLGNQVVGNISCAGDFSAANTPLWGVNHAGSAYVDGAGGGVKDIAGSASTASKTSADFIYTSEFDVGAVIIPANANGVPIGYGFIFGAHAACRAYGAIEMNAIKQDNDYGFVNGNGYEMVFGQAPTINTNGVTNGYLILEFAIEHEGYPVPSFDPDA